MSKKKKHKYETYDPLETKSGKISGEVYDIVIDDDIDLSDVNESDECQDSFEEEGSDNSYVGDEYLDEGYEEDDYTDTKYEEDEALDENYKDEEYLDDEYIDDKYIDDEDIADIDLDDEDLDDEDLDDEDDEYLDEEANKLLKKNKRKRKGLSLKTQLIFAAFFTIAILVIIPTLAWFSFKKEMAISTKINSPATLEIRAGGAPGQEQSIINFDLSDIDTEDESYNHYTVGTGDDAITYYYKDFVFCVKGKAISAYDLQLAHTTNIAFKYDVYRAVQDNTGPIVYTSLNKSVTQRYSLKRVKIDGSGNVVTEGGNIVYEDYDTPIDGVYINNVNPAGTRVLAKTGGDSGAIKDLTSRSYDGTDGYQKYANPAYWLKRGIPVYTEEKSDDGFTHSYVLRVSWIMTGTLTAEQREENLDIVQNNKETDIIYITAAVN